jgi:uncharacterized protein (DUF924 family)
MDTTTDARTTASEVLRYWFGTLDDESRLDRDAEPFRTCYARWYGKQPEIDAEIRERFEPALVAATADGARWHDVLSAWSAAPKGLLALVILLDQLPRNMYRDQRAMYVHDPLALTVATLAVQAYEKGRLSLVERMFLSVPLMHAENVTLQQSMVRRFEQLVEDAQTQSPHNVGFFRFACDYARKHLEVVTRYGRFPHRNALLGRASTPAELDYLQQPGAGF